MRSVQHCIRENADVVVDLQSTGLGLERCSSVPYQTKELWMTAGRESMFRGSCICVLDLLLAMLGFLLHGLSPASISCSFFFSS